MTEKQKKKLKKKLIVWVATVVFSILIISLCNKLVTKDLEILNYGDATCKAKVTLVGEKITQSYEAGSTWENYYLPFSARILTGPRKGELITSVQESDNYSGANEKELRQGDKIILYQLSEDSEELIFGGFARFDTMFVFGLIFCALLLFFGRIKGLNTIISLTFTCLSVFCVFVPSVLAGYNIYMTSMLCCIYITVMTLLLTNGASIKSYSTMLGCIFGVISAAIMSVLFDRIMGLTGILDEHSVYLQVLYEGREINLRAMIFAMIVIGAMGAVMDVAMDIASSLFELKRHAPQLGIKELYSSGIRIGRDVMGTMANTLVLAYIGSSLCSILLMISYSSSLQELLNRQNIVVEIMQALVGSVAILLTIPLTSLICGILYTRKRTKK